MQLTLDELKNKSNNDVEVESEGIKIVYKNDLEEYVNGSVVDYSNSWFGSGFVIKGNSVSSC